jgi:hypothetical protein
VAAFIPMVASQVLRLLQHDPGGWLFWDYAGRLGGLAVLAALARPVAFRRDKLRMPWMQIDTYTEEVVFRRCAREVFKPYVGDGMLMVLLTSLLFGAYHWWSGVGNILAAVLMGVLFLLFYRRSGALWPVVLSHYLTDVVSFA